MTADLSTSLHDLAGRSTLADNLMEAMARYLILALALVFVALWFHRDGLRGGLAAAAGAIIAVGIGAVLSALIPEQRPFVADHFTPLISHSADASFPSDHLLAIGGVAGGTWLASRPLAVATLLIGVLVAFARVYVGVHYVADVASGLAIGFAVGLAAWFLLRLAVPLLRLLDERLQRWHLRPVLLGVTAPRGSPASTAPGAPPRADAG